MKILKVIILAAAVMSCASLYAAKPTGRKPEANKPTSGRIQTSNQIVSPKVKQLMERARKGDAAAQNELGMCYFRGDGVPKNDTLAYRYFGQAALQKYPKGILNVAYCVRKGVGVKADSLKARDLYVNAIGIGKDSILNRLDEASKKDVFLAKTLAYVYNTGKGGVKRSLQGCKVYLKRAVDLGDKASLTPYATLCMRTRDNVSAQKAYKAAYENGDTAAGYWYARYLINGLGGDSDPGKGFILMNNYAQKGMPGAMEIYGMCLLEGNGVERNAAQGFEWLKKASLKGNLPAQWELAECYATGNGTDLDFLQAFRWMSREAMHSSVNRFKNWLKNAEENDTTKSYLLFMQGLKALHNKDFATSVKIAKLLGKQKLTKESKVLEGLTLLASDNKARNVKKGFKLLQPYFDTDPLVLFIVDEMQLDGKLNDLDKAQQRDVQKDLEKLAENGFGPAYSVLGDLSFIAAQNIQTILNWRKAIELDGLSYNSAQNLAKCYENGASGYKKDEAKAKAVRNFYLIDPVDKLLELVPEYTVK